MPNQQIPAGYTTNDVVLVSLSAFSPLWRIFNPSFSIIADVNTPNGWNMVLDPALATCSLTVPQNAIVATAYLIEISDPLGPFYYGNFVDITPYVPPPKPPGYTRRAINIPFRRHRPSPAIQAESDVYYHLILSSRSMIEKFNPKQAQHFSQIEADRAARRPPAP